MRIELLSLSALVLGACAPSAERSPERERALRGEMIFMVRCRRCHGGDGSGAGRDGESADLRASTLRREEVGRAITEGVAGTAMEPHALSSQDREAIVEYVMGLRSQRVQ